MEYFWKKLKEKFLYGSVIGALFVGFIVFTDFEYSIRMRALYSDLLKSRSVVGEWHCEGATTNFESYKFKNHINSNGTYSLFGVMSGLEEESNLLMEIGLKANGTYKKVDDKYIETVDELTVTAFKIEGVDVLNDSDVRSYIEPMERNSKGMNTVSKILSLDLNELILEEDDEVVRCSRS